MKKTIQKTQTELFNVIALSLHMGEYTSAHNEMKKIVLEKGIYYFLENYGTLLLCFYKKVIQEGLVQSKLLLEDLLGRKLSFTENTQLHTGMVNNLF